VRSQVQQFSVTSVVVPGTAVSVTVQATPRQLIKLGNFKVTL
jgi:hypothetical protein